MYIGHRYYIIYYIIHLIRKIYKTRRLFIYYNTSVIKFLIQVILSNCIILTYKLIAAFMFFVIE